MQDNSINVVNIEFNLLDFNPGSAKGFNIGLRTMMRQYFVVVLSC